MFMHIAQFRIIWGGGLPFFLTLLFRVNCSEMGSVLIAVIIPTTLKYFEVFFIS